jgi:peptidoglycan/LPS O-acetylase OafA/YrhL
LAETIDSNQGRLDYLDAARAFALVLGVVFHASLSFMPVFMGWAVQDISTSSWVTRFTILSHAFRLETFFLLAGFFSRWTCHREGPIPFVRSRALRIGVPFVVGWFILRPLLVSGWIMGSASLRGDVDVAAGLRGGFQSLATLPSGIFTGSHLWFLYYLAMITALTLVARRLVTATGAWREVVVRQADSLVAWLAVSPMSMAVLVMPTALTLWFMRSWGMDTPDQSLRPHLPALFLYGGFFVLGWLLNRQRDAMASFTRITPQRCLLAALGIASILLLGDIERDPGHPHFQLAHGTYAVGYATTMWSLVLLTLGAFRKFCSRPNAVIRYVADSSYWMYLVHLPIVVWLQVAVAELPLPWWLKLTLITLVTVALGLLTYDLVVRSTWLGALLHGRRRDRVLLPLFTDRDSWRPRLGVRSN